MKYQKFCLILLAVGSLLLQLLRAEEAPYEICFLQYEERSANASEAYAAQYDVCHRTGNETRFRVQRDKQPEREEIGDAAAEICAHIEQCNTLESDLDFFECHAKNGPFNMRTIVSIKLNSSLVLIDLEEQYDEAEKAVLKCAIRAQRDFAQETAAAFDDLMLCLKD